LHLIAPVIRPDGPGRIEAVRTSVDRVTSAPADKAVPLGVVADELSLKRDPSTCSKLEITLRPPHVSRTMPVFILTLIPLMAACPSLQMARS